MRRPTAYLGIAAVLFGLIAIASSPAGAQRGPRGRAEGISELEKPAVPKDDNEKRILTILDDMYANQRYRQSAHGRPTISGSDQYRSSPRVDCSTGNEFLPQEEIADLS